MKQWFDQVCVNLVAASQGMLIGMQQNIANPYPSEEQKAIFSNVSCA